MKFILRPSFKRREFDVEITFDDLSYSYQYVPPSVVESSVFRPSLYVATLRLRLEKLFTSAPLAHDASYLTSMLPKMLYSYHAEVNSAFIFYGGYLPYGRSRFSYLAVYPRLVPLFVRDCFAGTSIA